MLAGYLSSSRHEPAWKTFLSNKLLLVALWRLCPGHPNLLPAYADGPNGLTDGRRRAGLRSRG